MRRSKRIHTAGALSCSTASRSRTVRPPGRTEPGRQCPLYYRLLASRDPIDDEAARTAAAHAAVAGIFTKGPDKES